MCAPARCATAAAPGAASEDIAEATNAAFAGTWVIRGSACLLVRRAGARTALGGIAAALTAAAPATAFQTGLQRFGALIALALPLPPFAGELGFVRPRPAYFVFLAAAVAGFQATIELVKQGFCRRLGASARFRSNPRRLR
jgi:magnesium-transporting ATPase (P-type)